MWDLNSSDSDTEADTDDNESPLGGKRKREDGGNGAAHGFVGHIGDRSRALRRSASALSSASARFFRSAATSLFRPLSHRCQ